MPKRMRATEMLMDEDPFMTWADEILTMAATPNPEELPKCFELINCLETEEALNKLLAVIPHLTSSVEVEVAVLDDHVACCVDACGKLAVRIRARLPLSAIRHIVTTFECVCMRRDFHSAHVAVVERLLSMVEIDEVVAEVVHAQQLRTFLMDARQLQLCAAYQRLAMHLFEKCADFYTTKSVYEDAPAVRLLVEIAKIDEFRGRAIANMGKAVTRPVAMAMLVEHGAVEIVAASIAKYEHLASALKVHNKLYRGGFKPMDSVVTIENLFVWSVTANKRGYKSLSSALTLRMREDAHRLPGIKLFESLMVDHEDRDMMALLMGYMHTGEPLYQTWEPLLDRCMSLIPSGGGINLDDVLAAAVSGRADDFVRVVPREKIDAYLTRRLKHPTKASFSIVATLYDIAIATEPPRPQLEVLAELAVCTLTADPSSFWRKEAAVYLRKLRGASDAFMEDLVVYGGVSGEVGRLRHDRMKLFKSSFRLADDSVCDLGAGECVVRVLTLPTGHATFVVCKSVIAYQFNDIFAILSSQREPIATVGQWTEFFLCCYTDTTSTPHVAQMMWKLGFEAIARTLHENMHLGDCESHAYPPNRVFGVPRDCTPFTFDDADVTLLVCPDPLYPAYHPWGGAIRTMINASSDGVCPRGFMRIRCHRSIMSSRSPFFSALFSSRWATGRCVYDFTDIDVSTAAAVLWYIYEGYTTGLSHALSHDHALGLSVCVAADKYAMPGLCKEYNQH